MKPIRALLALLLVVLTGTVAACSWGGGDEPVKPDQITLPDGREVTVDGIPQRIVTLGAQWTDVALAFGVTPVGYYDTNQASTGTVAPWYGDKLADSTLIKPEGDVVGAVAAKDPDLILAPGFTTVSDTFDALSKLAPTIDRVSGEEVDPWKTMVTVMGTVLHQPEKAQQIIDDLDGKIAGLAEKNPGLKGKTFSIAYLYGSDQISALGKADDGAGQLFSALGLDVAPRLAQEAETTGRARFAVSPENLGWLDSDVMVMGVQNDDLRKRLEAMPGYKDLRSVKKGGVSLLSQLQITGLNEPSPGATAYALDQVTPALENAAKG